MLFYTSQILTFYQLPIYTLYPQQHLSERNVIRATMRGRGGADDDYTTGVSAALGDRLDALLDALVTDHDLPAGYNGIPTRYTPFTTNFNNLYTKNTL